ncbi:sulfotransferase [Muricauda sp. CAU 1633]|uniref:sulfotransferase family protein n=1 Tax=Allomuricauda sp. CAU 1633 TaxID=2816036 RepID=UPI001A8D3E30|nr:sulfotransferase [Muricauda sp. CAU 1633]MBO0323560.1 sulfotransferase [Muricauda sp. CAU 1633]
MGTNYLEQPIIFLGAPRSGTSVISEIVMRHKDLAYPSQYQSRVLGNTNINYLRRLADNPFWRFHGQKKQLNKVSLLNYFIFRSVEAYPMWNYLVRDGISFSQDFLINEEATPEEKKRIVSFFKKLVKKQGKKRLAFKITGPSRLNYLLSIFPDAKVVHITRDPIAVVNSLMRVPFWKTRGMTSFWWKGAYNDKDYDWLESNKSDSVQITAYQVKKVTEVTKNEIDKLRPDALRVEYSNFIKNPESTIQKILSYTGLSQDKVCFDYFIKNKIYNQNKNNETFFSPEEREKLQILFE